MQAYRLRKERDALAEQLRAHTSAKAPGGSISQEWLLRVFLSMPGSSSRSLAQSFLDCVGSDVNTVSRTSIGRVRDAWVELYKPMVLKVAANLVGFTMASAAATGAAFAPVFFLHVQDEADIRLRSADARDGPAMPSRSRASKVQQHVLTIFAAGGQVDVPTELEALGDKTAATLATSFERLLRSVVASVLPAATAQPQARPEVWVVHVLMGDGIGANEAAAKVLWACVEEAPFADRARYFLLVLKCLTHQTGLTAKSSVMGRVASATGGELWKTLTGVASRLFKFVITDYFEQFVSSVRDWVDHKLVVQSADDPEDTAATGAAKALQKLYTLHVVPEEMLALWNNGLSIMRHRLPPGEDPVQERPRIRDRFVHWISKHLLHVDSHPTLSRFFTFRDCIDRMLTMSLIDMPRKGLIVRSVKPRKENQARLKAVHGFFQHAEAPQTLRRTCLAFQLTGGVEAAVTTNPTTKDVPPVVRLLRRDVTGVLEERLQQVFSGIATGADPTLEVGPAVTMLVGTGMDLHVRIELFLDYPIKLCRLSKRWFPVVYLSHAHAFLETPVERLDVGVGAQLHQMAWGHGCGNEMRACAWLVSPPVQDLVDRMCEVTMTTSLPAERRHNEVKKWEASKLTHIAAASRNQITMRFLRWRQEKCREVDRKQKELRRALRTNVHSLAFQHIRPTGERMQPQATRQISQPQATQRRVADAVAGTAMSAYVAEHRPSLEARKAKLLAEADAELQKLLASLPLPATRDQWAEWLSNNIDEFKEQMRTATTRRRQGNVRMRARPGLPAPARRLQPQAARQRLTNATWVDLLANRTGWFGVQTREAGTLVVFLLLLRGRTWYLDLGNRVAVGKPQFICDSSFLLTDRVCDLCHLEELLADDEVLQIWEFQVLAFCYERNQFTFHSTRSYGIDLDWIVNSLLFILFSYS